MSKDTIYRQDAIDALIRKMRPQDNGDGTMAVYIMSERLVEETLNDLPSVQSDGWLEQNKDKILQSGMEGREIDFRIGGRLFAIREKAQ